MKLIQPLLLSLCLICTSPLLVRAQLKLGTGNAGLLGGDLTDTEDKIVDKGEYGSVLPEEKVKPEKANWLKLKSAPNSLPGSPPHQVNAYQSWQNTPTCAIFLNNPEKRKWYVGFKDGGFGGPTKDTPYHAALEFKDAYVLTHFTITTGPDMPGRDPKSWAIQGSLTGADDDWVDIYRCDPKDRASSPLRETPRNETTLFTAFTTETMAKTVTTKDFERLKARLKDKSIVKADFELPKKAYPWLRIAIYSCFNPNSTTFDDFNRPPGFALGQLELYGVPGIREKPTPAKVRPFDPPFIISAWSGPAATPERYKEYAECGFNLVLNTDIARPTDALLARSAGLKTIVADKQLFTFKTDHPEFAKNVQNVVAKYTNDPNVVGLFLMDEPNASKFPELKAFNDEIEKSNPKLVPFVNLLPTYAPPTAIGAKSYEDYVRRYIRAINPPFVCWDHYPLLDNTTTRPDYFENLEIISRVCREKGLPFVQVICSVPHGMYRPQDEADIRWQAYTTLAYGARGIIYFTYTTPPNDGWGYHDAILNAKGERTVRFGYVQRMNKKLAALAPLMVKLTGAGVAHSDPVPRGGSGFDKNFPVASAKGGAVSVGWLQDNENKDYLFVVNRHFGIYQSWINTWQFSGPYQSEGKSAKQLLDIPFSPETPGDKDTSWKTVSGPASSSPEAAEGIMDLVSLQGGEKPNSVAYLQARVKSPIKQEVILTFGATVSMKAWLNGKLVHTANSTRLLVLDQDKIKVVLEAGWNDLLVKVAQGSGASKVCARFVDSKTATNAQPGNTVPIPALEVEGEKLRPDDVGAREFTLAIQGKATHVSEVSQETGLPTSAAFDPEKRLLTVKLLAGEGKLFKLSEKGVSLASLPEFQGGQPLELNNVVFVPEKPNATTSGKLFWRRKGESEYASLSLASVASDRFKVTLPESVTKAPFEFYLEMLEAGAKPVYEPAQGSQSPRLVMPDLTPPTPVLDLIASANKSYRVALGWKSATDDRKVVEYRVYRGTTDQFKLDGGTQLAKLAPDTLIFTDNMPTPKSTIWYAVRAIDIVGRLGEPRYLKVEVPGHQPPVNLLTVQAQPGSKSIMLTWSGELEPIVSSFEIHRGEGKDGVMTKIGEVLDRKTAQYVDKEAKPGTEYLYTVRPRSSAGLLGEPGKIVKAAPLRYLKRINCGGPEIVSADGVPWEADTGEGHEALKFGGTRIWTIGGDVSKDIHQTERWSNGSIVYSIKVDPGQYEVVLHFSETNSNFAVKGKRQFNIEINEKVLAEKIDIFNEAGGQAKPWLFRKVVDVTGEEIEIKLTAKPIGPAIKALEIRGLPPKK